MLSLSAVWACIDQISRAIGQCPWNIYAPLGNGRRELLTEDALMWVLNTRPNPDQTAISFREAMLFTALPYGNAYAEIVPNAGGRIAELWPLPYERVRPRRDRATWELYYEYIAPTGELVRLPAQRVFHLRGPGLDGLMGDSIVARAAKSLALAAAQERHSASYFGQGANPGGVLEFPGKLADDAYERLKRDWAEKRQGPDNAHRPMILESGMKWTASSQDPQKSQLVESRQFSVEEIARWFGVPLHKIQHLLHATFSNIEHQSIEFVRDAVNPWCKRIEQEADYKLFRQDRGPWRYTCFDTSPLLQGDAKARAEAHAIWRQNGIMSANEIRAREGLNDLGEDGDVLLVQANLTTVERLVEPEAAAPMPAALPPGAPAPAEPPDPVEPVEPADPADQVDAMAAQARDALELFVVGALERYTRRMENRRTDLARRLSPSEVEAHMTAERERCLERMRAELKPAARFARQAFGRELDASVLQRAAALVNAGELPAAAAAKALPAGCPHPG